MRNSQALEADARAFHTRAGAQSTGPGADGLASTVD